MGEVMKFLLEKISSYNIFNHLLPGIASCYLINNFTGFSIPKVTVWVDLFVYYSVGLVMSRVGSLVVDPCLKCIKLKKNNTDNEKIPFINPADYGDYLKAVDKDTLILTLNETNNLYRTLVAVFFVMILIKLIEVIQRIDEVWFLLLCLLAVVLFAFSYKKQTDYVRKRVEKRIKAKAIIKTQKRRSRKDEHN